MYYNIRKSSVDEVPWQARANTNLKILHLFDDNTRVHFPARRFLTLISLLLILPLMICLNERFSDEFTADAQLWLTVYNLLSRRNLRNLKFDVVLFICIGGFHLAHCFSCTRRRF